MVDYVPIISNLRKSSYKQMTTVSPFMGNFRGDPIYLRNDILLQIYREAYCPRVHIVRIWNLVTTIYVARGRRDKRVEPERSHSRYVPMHVHVNMIL